MDIAEEKSYNLALVTLKERCHFLKEQLKTVDEENIKLKVQLANHNLKPDKSPLQDTLLGRIEVLTKQKTQQSNQIHILATENSNMWLRLSKLSITNRALNHKINKAVYVLHQNGLQINFKDIDESTDTAEGYDSKRNLEDMSLKLISGIQLDKNELEKQYAQMVALHSKEKSHNSGVDFGFNSSDIEDDNALSRVRRHAFKMNVIKQKLIQQQRMVVHAVEELKKTSEPRLTAQAAKINVKEVATETDLQPIYVSHPSRSTVEVNANEIEVRDDDNDQVCPLCGNHIAGSIDIFCDHVSSHMNDEPNSFELVS